MTTKKVKLYFAADIDKEAEWLTDMSSKGLQFVDYKPFLYYFEEDKDKSYIYQTDFQEAKEDYFQLYEDAGWEHVTSFMDTFHYFRAEKNKIGDKKIYTDPESLKALYRRMFIFYLSVFLGVSVAQFGVFLTWEGAFFQKFVVALYILVVLIYAYLLLTLLIKSRRKKE